MEVLLANEQYFDYFRTWCWPNVFTGYNYSILANTSSLSECITAELRDGKKLGKKEKDTHLSPVLYAMIYLVQHGKALQKELPGIGLTAHHFWITISYAQPLGSTLWLPLPTKDPRIWQLVGRASLHCLWAVFLVPCYNIPMVTLTKGLGPMKFRLDWSSHQPL